MGCLSMRSFLSVWASVNAFLPFCLGECQASNIPMCVRCNHTGTLYICAAAADVQGESSGDESESAHDSDSGDSDSSTSDRKRTAPLFIIRINYFI